MKSIVLFLFSLLGVVIVKGQDGKQKQPVKSDTVFVKGLIDSPYFITKNSLSSFAVQEGKNLTITGPGGKIRRSIASYKGILLTDILSKAHITLKNEKDRGKYFITVTATDGYTAIFSYNELMFAGAGKNTSLLFEEDGKAIDDGPFVIVCASDLVTGPRHVKWVKDIEVRRIE